jgi:hypothetical protein
MKYASFKNLMLEDRIFAQHHMQGFKIQGDGFSNNNDLSRFKSSLRFTCPDYKNAF